MTAAVKSCAVCGGATYDAEPATLAVEGCPNGVRVWLCSAECAWEAGKQTARRCGLSPTLPVLRELFKADGLEVLP